MNLIQQIAAEHQSIADNLNMIAEVLTQKIKTKGVKINRNIDGWFVLAHAGKMLFSVKAVPTHFGKQVEFVTVTGGTVKLDRKGFEHGIAFALCVAGSENLEV